MSSKLRRAISIGLGMLLAVPLTIGLMTAVPAQAQTYTLYVSTSDYGTVTAPGAVPANTANVEFTGLSGATTITAVPAEGYEFAFWTASNGQTGGTTVGKIANANAASTTITMDGDYGIKAWFFHPGDQIKFKLDADTATGGYQNSVTVGDPTILKPVNTTTAFNVRLYVDLGTIPSTGVDAFISYNGTYINGPTSTNLIILPTATAGTLQALPEWQMVKVKEVHDTGDDKSTGIGWAYGYIKISLSGDRVRTGVVEVAQIPLRAMAATTVAPYYVTQGYLMTDPLLTKAGVPAALVKDTDYSYGTFEGFSVEADTLPVISITTPGSDTAITAGQTQAFVASLDSGGPVTDANWKWDFNYHEGDTDVDATTKTPAAQGWSNVAGTYVVRVTATNSAGTAAATRTITVQPASASYFTVTESAGGTSSATITAGGSVELTVKAYDQYNNLCSGGTNAYSGDFNLDFSGPVASQDGNQPKVEGVDVVGAGTKSVHFTAGVSDAETATLTAYKAETPTVNVVAGAVNSTGHGLALTVNADAANKLVYTQQPAAAEGATVDVAFATQPVLEVRDQYGNLRTGDNATSITLAAVLTSDDTTAGAGTIRNGTMTVTGGIATFTTVGYSKSGEAIHIKATSNPVLTPAVSTVSINLAVGNATKLVFTQQPASSGSVDVAFTTQPVVQVQDQYGNLRAADNATALTLAAVLASDDTTAGAGTLRNGTMTVTGGVATFATVGYSKSGETIHIKVTSNPVLTQAVSTTDITLAAGAATKLVYTQQPAVAGDATVDTAFATQPVVQVQDQYNNLRTGDNATSITLSAVLATNDTDAGTGTIRNGTMTVTGGVATFATVGYSKSGETIHIKATSNPVLTPAVSTADITLAVGNANKLVFTQQPASTGSVDVAFTTQPVVQVQDQYGNLRAADNVTSLTLSAVLATNDADAGTGTIRNNTMTVTGGIATFATLGYSKSGETIHISVISAPVLTPAVSTVDITLAAGALDHVDVSPTNPTVITTDTRQFTAVAKDQYNNTITATFTWSIDPAKTAAGNIDENGLFTAGTTFDTYTGAIRAETTVSAVTRTGTTGVTVVGATITVTATLQGDSRPLAGYNVALVFKLHDALINTANITSAVATSDYTTANGKIVITGTPTQEEITAKTNKTVTFTVSGLPVVTGKFATLYSPQCIVNTRSSVDIAKTGTTFSMGELIAGDSVDISESSKTIDVDDFTRFAGAYEAVAGPPASGNWEARADFDKNGLVTIIDFSLLYTNYGKTSPQLVNPT